MCCRSGLSSGFKPFPPEGVGFGKEWVRWCWSGVDRCCAEWSELQSGNTEVRQSCGKTSAVSKLVRWADKVLTSFKYFSPQQIGWLSPHTGGLCCPGLQSEVQPCTSEGSGSWKKWPQRPWTPKPYWVFGRARMSSGDTKVSVVSTWCLKLIM